MRVLLEGGYETSTKVDGGYKGKRRWQIRATLATSRPHQQSRKQSELTLEAESEAHSGDKEKLYALNTVKVLDQRIEGRPSSLQRSKRFSFEIDQSLMHPDRKTLDAVDSLSRLP